MQTEQIRRRLAVSARNSTVARRLRSAVRTYPTLDALARRVIRDRPELRRLASEIPSTERSPNEIVNTLALDLIKRRRFAEAITTLELFLQERPSASRSRFIKGVVHLYVGDFDTGRRDIDQAYRETWTLRDDLSHLPGWHRLVTAAAAAHPDWAWPEYVRLKSQSRVTPASPESLLDLIDEREPGTVVEFSVKFGQRRHHERPPVRRRMRVLVFEGTRSSIPLQRLRLHAIDDKAIAHVSALAGAAEQPGSWHDGTAAALLADVATSDVAKVHIDAEYASADILGDLLSSGFEPSVITIALYRMTLEQRVRTMHRLVERGMFYQLDANDLIAVDEQLVADRRVHGWRVSDADYADLVDDYLAVPAVRLADWFRDTLIRNQVRFLVTPTEDARTTRFSLTNGDKGYAVSRLMEFSEPGLEVHVPALASVSTSTPLIRAYLVDGRRRFLHDQIELDFWTNRGDYVRTGNLNQLVNWVPIAEVERTMFAHNPAFLTLDSNPPVTMEERLGLGASVMHHLEFPIDVVFTWVDGDDPVWLTKRAQRIGAPASGPQVVDHSVQRYTNRDELRFALRSIAAFFPCVRHIYLVTDDQRPTWLDTSHPGITVVDHRDIFEDPADLPSFNSNAIETQLKNIDGLSEHFVYFNDDVLLMGPTPPSTFFFANGMTKSFFERQRSQYGRPSPAFHNSKNAVLNASTAFDAKYGRTFHQFHRHTPFPLRRSVLEDMGKEFYDELKRTAGHHGRSIDDIAPISSLYQWYAFHHGQAIPSAIHSQYINLGAPDVLESLEDLELRAGTGVLCINDGANDLVDPAAIDEALRRALLRLYPTPAPWEVSQ